MGVSVSDESVPGAREPSAFLNVSFELEVNDNTLGIQLVCRGRGRCWSETGSDARIVDEDKG